MEDTGPRIPQRAGCPKPGAEGKKGNGSVIGTVAATVIILLFSTAGIAIAHCDTLDGPVVSQARQALSKGDVKIVLPWVAADKEKEIRKAFDLTMAVRGKGEKEKELADMYFFETLVRVPREGEGAPYTGLKPAGMDLGPAIPAADKALETGDPRPLLTLINGKAHAKESVEAGRAYVQAYVPYLHFAERLYNDAVTPIAHGSGDIGEGKHGHPEPGSSPHLH